MSLSNTVVKQIFQGDNSVVDFAIPFKVIENASNETVVFLRDETDLANIIETLQVEGVDYDLTGSPLDNVQFNTAPTANEKVLVKRTKALTQDKDFSNSVRTDVEANEEGLDISTALTQELLERIDRAPLLPVTTTKSAFIMPEPAINTVYGYDVNRVFKLFTIAELDVIASGSFLLVADFSPWEKNFTRNLDNNVTSVKDIVGIKGVGSTDSSLNIELEFTRKDDTDEIMANAALVLQKLPVTGTWRIAGLSWDGDDGVIDTLNPAGVTLSLRVDGADIFVQYISDNMVGGSYDTVNSLIKVSIKRF